MTDREKLFDLMMRDPCPSPVVCNPNCEYYRSHHCHADRYADHLIANGVTVQQWISVKDRLPEKDVRVLVWMQDNEEGYTQMDTDRFSCTMEQGYHWIRWGKNVTHWMPLPEPPKGE